MSRAEGRRASAAERQLTVSFLEQSSLSLEDGDRHEGQQPRPGVTGHKLLQAELGAALRQKAWFEVQCRWVLTRGPIVSLEMQNLK